MLLAAWLFAYGLRTLVSAGVLAFRVLGPFAPHLADASAAPKSFGGRTIPKCRLFIGARDRSGQFRGSQVDRDSAAGHALAHDAFIVHSEMRGTSEIIHVVKVDDSGGLSGLPASLLCHLFCR